MGSRKVAAVILGIAAACGIETPARSQAPALKSAYQEAQDLEARGKLQEAEARLRSILAQKPNELRALTSLGVVLSKEGKYAESIADYRKALAINPRVPGLQFNLGLAYFKMGDFRAAVAPLRRALELDPSNLQGRTLLGMAYYGSGSYREAAAHLSQVSGAEPQNTQLLYVIADSYLRAGEYEQVLKVFEKLQREHPQSAAAHMLMAQALDGLHRTHEAIEELQVAGAIAPGQPNVHFDLGYLYWKDKKFDEAEMEFQRELQNDAAHGEAKAYLGDIELRRGNFPQAARLVEQALKLRRDLRIAHLDLGIIYSHEKKYPNAVAELKEAIRIDPSQADAHYRLSITYQAMGREREAEAERRRVAELHEQTREELLHEISAPPPLPHPD